MEQPVYTFEEASMPEYVLQEVLKQVNEKNMFERRQALVSNMVLISVAVYCRDLILQLRFNLKVGRWLYWDGIWLAFQRQDLEKLWLSFFQP